MIKILNIIILMMFLIGVVYIFSFFQKDEYVGFFYPDSSNLFYDIQSDQIFEDLDSCRLWAKSTALDNASEILNNNYDWDYECGKNCDFSKGKPYICEETLK